MAGETFLTVIGNLTADPELRFTPSGKCVADFTVASTPRFFDRGANEWKDGESLFMRCSLWGEAAENVSESLRKGMRVIAVGRLNQRSFETKSGEHRSVVELLVDEVGPSLRRAKAQVVRSQAAQPGSYVNAYSGQQTQGVYQPQQQAQPPRQEAAPPQQQAQPPQQEYQQPTPAQVRSTTVESQGVGQGSPFNYSQQQRQEQPPQGWGSFGAAEEPPF